MRLSDGRERQLRQRAVRDIVEAGDGEVTRHGDAGLSGRRMAERHGADRSIALAEANAGSYIASLTAAVATGLFTAIGLDWRNGLALGIALAAVALARNLGDPIPAARPRSESGAGRLPAAYWAYWATLFCVIALEYCTLLWAPEVLERVQGLSRPSAAAMAAAFSAAMLIGRLFAAPLLRRMSAQRLFLASLALTLPGIVLYVGVRQPVLSVVGLVVLGLGTALLYPLTLGFAIGVAGRHGEVASARASLASGVAILIMPTALGTLADGLGLRLAFCSSWLCRRSRFPVLCRGPRAGVPPLSL